MSAPINCCRELDTASPALTTFYSGGADYDAVTTSATFTSGSANSMQQSINIIEDLDFEPTEERSEREWGTDWERERGLVWERERGLVWEQERGLVWEQERGLVWEQERGLVWEQERRVGLG